MGILDRAIQDNATHTFSVEDTEYTVKRVSMVDVLMHIEKEINPKITDEADIRKERARITNEFIGKTALLSVKDPDIADTPEARFALMTDPAFSADAREISNAALTEDNFVMQREAAVKKFCAITSAQSGNGKKTTATKTRQPPGTSTTTKKLESLAL